jgi:hypothetical protein
MDNLAAQAQTIQKSEDTFKLLLEDLMVKYKEHSATVENSTTAICADAKAGTEAGKRVLETITETVEECSTEKEKSMADAKKESELAEENATAFRIKFAEFKSGVVTGVESGRTAVSHMTEQREQTMKEYKENVKQKIEERKQNSKTFQKSIQVLYILI